MQRNPIEFITCTSCNDQATPLTNFRKITLALAFTFVSALSTAGISAEPAVPTPLVTNGGKLDQDAALALSQSVLGKIPSDYTFLNRKERPVRLSDFRGKPVLVSFIYTGCFQICPTSTRSLNEAVKTLQEIVGPDQFNVISIGFNQPFDSPSALRAFSAQHAIGAANWDFLSPHISIVDSLTKDFGFSHNSTASGIDHILQVTILDGQGRIYAQVYGERLTPDQLGEPLRQLLQRAPIPQTLRLNDVVNRIRILCTVYDPKTGSYRYDYGLILEIAGGCTFFLTMLFLFLNEWLSQRRNKRKLRDTTSAQGAPAT